MSLKKLNIIKYYFNLYLVEEIIYVYLTPYLSLVLYVKKPVREI